MGPEVGAYGQEMIEFEYFEEKMRGEMEETQKSLPLSGIRVLELSPAIMGPTCGLISADMGAEEIKIERAPEGHGIRRLKGFKEADSFGGCISVEFCSGDGREAWVWL